MWSGSIDLRFFRRAGLHMPRTDLLDWLLFLLQLVREAGRVQEPPILEECGTGRHQQVPDAASDECERVPTNEREIQDASFRRRSSK